MSLSEEEKKNILEALDVRRGDWTPQRTQDTIEGNSAQDLLDSGAHQFTKSIFREFFNASVSGKPENGKTPFKGEETVEAFDRAKIIHQLVESKIREAGLEIPWPEDFSGARIPYKQRRAAEKAKGRDGRG